jgi:hypothetical protein
VYPVNPHHESVLGMPCVASARDLSVAADVAVIAVPADRVAAVVQDCGERGVHGLILLTAGFGETGDAGMARQDEVVGIARAFGMRILGPNCLGLVNTDPAIHLNATFGGMPMRPGRLGLISQSGALGIAVVNAAARRGLASEAEKDRMCTRPPSARTASTPSNVRRPPAAGVTESVLMLVLSSSVNPPGAAPRAGRVPAGRRWVLRG